MGLLKSKTTKPAPAAAETFRVPTMAELSTEYRERQERFISLNSDIGRLRQEADQVQRELAETPAPAVRPGVAALLGDPAVDRRGELLARLADLRRQITDHETAIELQRTRVAQERDRASRLVRDAVRPEYGRRVRELVTRLQAAMEARTALDDLINIMERDDVSWLALGVFRAKFLGDADDGQVAQMVREARELGYVD